MMTSIKITYNYCVLLLFFILMFFLWPLLSVQADSEPGPVRRSGQNTSYATGDDGHLQKGLAWPNPRFTDLGDGTIKDYLTGLIWIKNANCWGSLSWSNALSRITGMNNGSQSCSGYVTGTHTDWRLPNIHELQSLVDAGRFNPALPTDHPFSGVQSYYWSATPYAGNSGDAWYMSLADSHVFCHRKTNGYAVWPVRGGQ